MVYVGLHVVFPLLHVAISSPCFINQIDLVLAFKVLLLYVIHSTLFIAFFPPFHFNAIAFFFLQLTFFFEITGVLIQLPIYLYC